MLMWYLGSGCSRHMTGDKKKFVNFQRKEQGFCHLWRQQ